MHIERTVSYTNGILVKKRTEAQNLCLRADFYSISYIRVWSSAPMTTSDYTLKLWKICQMMTGSQSVITAASGICVSFAVLG